MIEEMVLLIHVLMANDEQMHTHTHAYIHTHTHTYTHTHVYTQKRLIIKMIVD